MHTVIDILLRSIKIAACIVVFACAAEFLSGYLSILVRTAAAMFAFVFLLQSIVRYENREHNEIFLSKKGDMFLVRTGAGYYFFRKEDMNDENEYFIDHAALAIGLRKFVFIHPGLFDTLTAVINTEDEKNRDKYDFSNIEKVGEMMRPYMRGLYIDAFMKPSLNPVTGFAAEIAAFRLMFDNYQRTALVRENKEQAVVFRDVEPQPAGEIMSFITGGGQISFVFDDQNDLEDFLRWNEENNGLEAEEDTGAGAEEGQEKSLQKMYL